MVGTGLLLTLRSDRRSDRLLMPTLHSAVDPLGATWIGTPGARAGIAREEARLHREVGGRRCNVRRPRRAGAGAGATIVEPGPQAGFACPGPVRGAVDGAVVGIHLPVPKAVGSDHRQTGNGDRRPGGTRNRSGGSQRARVAACGRPTPGDAPGLGRTLPAAIART